MTAPKFTSSLQLLLFILLSISIPNIKGNPTPGPPLATTPLTNPTPLTPATTPVPVLTPPPPPPPPAGPSYYPINVPIGAGEPQTARPFPPKPFGSFHDAFTKCGKSTVSNLNEAITGTSVEVFVTCDPTPNRITVSKDAVTFDKFTRDFKQECELLECSGTDALAKDTDMARTANTDGTKYPGLSKAPQPEDPTLQTCEAKTVQFAGQTPGKYLIANEGNCYGMNQQLKKRFEDTATSQNYAQIPRWLKAGEETINARTFFFEDEKAESLERVPFVFPHPTAPTVTYTQCDTTCDQGTVVKITMNQASYKSMIYVNAKECSSFRICFNAKDFHVDTVIPTCAPDFTIDVLFKSGVIVWGKKGRGSVIELMSQHHDEAFLVPIEFGYGVESKDKSKIFGEFYFGNDHREVVTSDSGGYSEMDASLLTFLFPSDKCLFPKAGIFSKQIHLGKTLAEDPTKVVKGTTFNQQGQPINGPTAEATTLTPEAEKVQNLIPSTTPAAPRIIPEAGALSLVAEDEAASKAVYSEGKWWTWGIYLGFVIGTLLSLGIGGGLFYLLRRTVFGVWYRGMYKRYGCDASGTTGGITGIGFGATTAAMETVATGATGNTMGATTGGASTMGTTGGGTTGSGTTSGASTIAM